MKIFILTFFLTFVFSCQFKKKEKQEIKNQSTIPQVVFPHPDNYKDIDQHGFMYLSDLGKYCKDCHGDQLQGSETADSCSTCHPSYPHQWKDKPKEHAVQAQKDRETCYKCHSLSVNKSAPKEIEAKLPPTCISCHQYPHDKNWNVPGQETSHGYVYLNLKSNTEQIKKCHNCHIESTSTAPSCKSCHDFYPHDDQIKIQHKSQEFKLDSEKINNSCLKCHNLQTDKTKLLYEQESCYSCHNYPHPKSTWLDKNSNKFHGADYIYGSKEKCQNCHGQNLTGMTLNDGKTCYNCHKTYPHTQNNWKTSGHQDAYRFEVQQSENNALKCNSCHGINYEGSKSASSCSTCHQGYPHTWQKFPISRTHGQQYISEKTKGLAPSCINCHGTNLTGSSSAPSCTQCHKYFPHVQNKLYQSNHFFNSIDRSTCKDCHSGNMKEWQRPDTCSSIGCHTTFDQKSTTERQKLL